MTDEQINAAIAEACGWKEITNCTCGGKKRGCPPGSHTSSHVQNYCADLNAMHEAEKVILKDGFDSDLYLDYLMAVVMAAPAGLSNHATARQRAEAFLRTIGKWEEAK